MKDRLSAAFNTKGELLYSFTEGDAGKVHPTTTQSSAEHLGCMSAPASPAADKIQRIKEELRAKVCRDVAPDPKLSKAKTTFTAEEKRGLLKGTFLEHFADSDETRIVLTRDGYMGMMTIGDVTAGIQLTDGGQQDEDDEGENVDEGKCDDGSNYAAEVEKSKEEENATTSANGTEDNQVHSAAKTKFDSQAETTIESLQLTARNQDKLRKRLKSVLAKVSRNEVIILGLLVWSVFAFGLIIGYLAMKVIG